MNNFKLLRCGKLFNGIDEKLIPNMEILINENKIASVGQNLEHPKETEIIDLGNYTITPGLIDAHMHTQHFDWHNRQNEIIFRGPSWKGMAHLYNAREALYRGFTAIRCIGSSTYEARGSLVAKELINLGYFSGARMCVTPHYFASVGGHGDHSQYLRTNPELSEFFANLTPTMGTGSDFFRHAVRNEIKMGADYVKMMINGGFSTPNDSPDDQQLSDEEIKTIIDTTHELGRTCTAHIYNSEQMKKVTLMGIDGMEHGSLITEDTAELMEKRNVYLVPTFCPYEDIINLNEETLKLKSPAFRIKLKQYSERLREGRRVIVQSNLRLGYGTDFVSVHNPFESGYEYEAWMNAGMGAFRTLRAATIVNAGILGMQDKIGSIEAGKLADISAWGRDLLTDPKALLDCSFVMKDGVVYPTIKVE